MVTITFGTIGRHCLIQSANLRSRGGQPVLGSRDSAANPPRKWEPARSHPSSKDLLEFGAELVDPRELCIERECELVGVEPRPRPLGVRGVDAAPMSRYTPRFPVRFPASARESQDVWSWESSGTSVRGRAFGNLFWSPDGGMMVSPPPVECLLQGVPESLARASAVIVARREVRCRKRSSNN